MEEITSVKRVCVEVPERDKKYANLKNFQFEIFINQGNEDPKFESKVITKENSEKSYTNPLKEKEIQNSNNKVEVIDIEKTTPKKND